jgi:cobalt-zinc-cadmium efflux system membrane fusion protein
MKYQRTRSPRAGAPRCTRAFQTGSLTALALAALLPLGCGHQEAQQAEAQDAHEHRDTLELGESAPQLKYIKIETVGETDTGASVTLTGKVTFNENTTQRVASPIDGRATKVLVEVGDNVTQGQVLVELSSPNIGQLRADVKKAELEVALDKKSLDRVKNLVATGAIAAKEEAQAESDYAKAQAELSSARARFGSLNLALGGAGAGIRAQVAGTVVDREVLVGQEVRADQTTPLLTISDLSTVWVVADLFEQDLPLVHSGDEVQVTVAAYPGVSFPGKVGVVSNVIDPNTHTLKLRCVVPNADFKLKPEMFARIAVKDGESKLLTVSSRAVLSDTQPPRVVVVEGSKYSLREVAVGPEVAGRVRVLSGLAKGERVVADGAIFVKQEIQSQ